MSGYVLSYEQVCERFQKYNCHVLTTKEEYVRRGLVLKNALLLKMPCGHDRELNYHRMVTYPDLLCEECSLRRMQNRLYKEVQDRFADYNCKLLTTFEEFLDKGMKISIPFLYEATCGHENVGDTRGFLKNPDGLCKKCMRDKLNDAKRFSYEFVAERFAQYKCQLLTTKEEFIEKKLKAESMFLVKMPCGHERESNFKMVKDIQDMVCKDCTRKRTQAGLYENMVKRFEEYGCKLLTSMEEYIENNLHAGSALRYVGTCGHERVGYICLLRENTTCKECTFQKFRHEKRLPYDVLKANFEKDGCQLLTLEDEYNERSMTFRDECLLRMTCGHERMCAWKNFQLSTITLCQECAWEKMGKYNQLNSKIDGNAKGNVIEYRAFVYIRNLIKHFLDVKKLREGTKADFLVRPKSVHDDVWLPIQLKTAVAQRARGEYAFGMKPDYSGLVILCVCVEEEKIWMFDGEISKNITGIAINDTSKYDYGRVALEDTVGKFTRFYEGVEIPNVSYGEANIPISPSHQLEYEYQLLRENQLSEFFNFEYPELEGQVFDFVLNDMYKVQEKVAVVVKAASVATAGVHLEKHDGKDKRTNYSKGDNDFYWIACQDKDTFYVFPESILIEKGFITTPEKAGCIKTMSLHYTISSTEEFYNTNTRFMDAWAFPFRYKYSNLDLPKLKSLFV